MNAVYKPADDIKTVIDELLASKEKMSPDQWDTLLSERLPDLKTKLDEDYLSERVRFKSFRGCGQQLSKCLANLDRLKRRAGMGEDVAAEIATREKQILKMRKNGILPSVGTCVFEQLDLDKSGTISTDELKRLYESLAHVYSPAKGEVAEVMKAMDSDKSGEIDEKEWRQNLTKCPGLLRAMIEDLDNDTGKLRSYRTVEDQLAKCLGNVQRLEYDLQKGNADASTIKAELESRKKLVAEMRANGVKPAPGIIVFNQIDLKKTRQIGKPELKNVLSKLNLNENWADEIMQHLDLDENGYIDEDEWLTGLDRAPSLKAALEKNIDVETGMLKCL
jgi:Ca2+-binding EF-hand superfamily protein